MNRVFVTTALLCTALLAGTATAQDTPRVAYLAASSENGYNQAIYEGVQKAAAERGIDVEIFNGEFNAGVQFAQVEDIIAGGNFAGIVITPNDTVGVAAALEEATAAGLKVATTLFPVGPQLDTLEPQVPGLTVTVAANPGIGARAQAEKVVEFCADKDPCKVVIMIGQLIYPFDNLRYETFQEVLGEHDNIEVVATVEGNYDPDQSLTGMQDVLQANSDLDAVLSNADQHLVGAEIALNDAGIDVPSLYLIGGGANQIAIDAIKEGRWDATLSEAPVSMGYRAMMGIADAIEGKETPAFVDAGTLLIAPILTKEVLDANPDFVAEWEG